MLSCGPQRREKALFEGHKRGPSATQGHGPRWGERGTRLPKTPSQGLGSPRLPRKGRGGGVVPPAAGGAMRLLEHTTRVPSSERGELTARGEDMGRLRPERGQASAQRRASQMHPSGWMCPGPTQRQPVGASCLLLGQTTAAPGTPPVRAGSLRMAPPARQSRPPMSPAAETPEVHP